MNTLKTFGKYILWIIGFYLLTSFLIFVGFNANYKKIDIKENPPQQISIDKAEASKTEARINGKIQNSEESNLNGKYLKITVYDEKNNDIGTEFLKIENLDSNEKKSFKSQINAENVKSYDIYIIDGK